MQSDDEYGVPGGSGDVTPDEQAAAISRVEAARVLNEAAQGGDWRAAAWLLERRQWREYGVWHEQCMVGVDPPAITQPDTDVARAAAAFLEASGPDYWRARCRVCGEPL